LDARRLSAFAQHGIALTMAQQRLLHHNRGIAAGLGYPRYVTGHLKLCDRRLDRGEEVLSPPRDPASIRA
jgi:hypothetical protein